MAPYRRTTFHLPAGRKRGAPSLRRGRRGRRRRGTVAGAGAAPAGAGAAAWSGGARADVRLERRRPGGRLCALGAACRIAAGIARARAAVHHRQRQREAGNSPPHHRDILVGSPPGDHPARSPYQSHPSWPAPACLPAGARLPRGRWHRDKENENQRVHVSPGPCQLQCRKSLKPNLGLILGQRSTPLPPRWPPPSASRPRRPPAPVDLVLGQQPRDVCMFTDPHSTGSAPVPGAVQHVPVPDAPGGVSAAPPCRCRLPAPARMR